MAGSADQQKIQRIREVQPDGSVLLHGRNIRLRIRVLKPGFLLITAKGNVNGPEDAAAEAALLREFELELERSGMLTIFADLRESARMSAESREIFVAWMRKHQGRINTAHILVHSKLMEMAVSIVGMLAGDGVIKTYSRAQSFLEILRQTAPKQTDLPTI